MKATARVVDVGERPILLEIKDADTLIRGSDTSGAEVTLEPEEAFSLALDLLRAAARVGVTVRD